ncbi:ankyrin [Nemania sp. FL0916]|nr:ankyrin [Nemania sp. FL0916]
MPPVPFFSTLLRPNEAFKHPIPSQCSREVSFQPASTRILMEPLSTIASGFAVVSLALQLVDSAYSIKAFFDAIQDAPAEVSRLKNRITQLHTTAKSIVSLLKHQRRLPGWDSQISDNICSSLETCLETLGLIRDVLKIAEKVDSGQNSAISRHWVQIRLAHKKEKLEEFERQLDQAMTSLNTNLLSNSIHLSLLIDSDIQSLIKALPKYQHPLLPGTNPSNNLPGQGMMPTLSPSIYLIPRTSKPTVRKTWSTQGIIVLEYSKLSGRNEQQSLICRVNICNSYMLTVQLFRPFFGRQPVIPFNISVRNMVPSNAAIFNACRNGDVEEVRQLLKSRIAGPNDTTLEYETPLRAAIDGDCEEIVRLLLREGADPDLPSGKPQVSPLQYGVSLDRQNIVRLLAQQGADPTYTSAVGRSLFHYMFQEGKQTSSTVYFSLFENCIMFDDVKDSAGWTALHRCAAYGTPEDFHHLHRIGAPSCSDRYVTRWGGNPIHVAALMNNLPMLKAFFDLRNGQLDAIEFVDNDGWTPLHYAASRGATETMSWLLRQGANPHCKTLLSRPFADSPEEGVFNAADLAIQSGKVCQEAFVETLNDMGHNITVHGGDIYWESA